MSALWPWPCSWNQGLLYRIDYIIIVVIIKGEFKLDSGPLHLVAAARRLRGRAPWHTIGRRWPSGATSGISQAFLILTVALRTWSGT